MEQKRAKIINRLKTIKGHIAGIEKMIEEGKPCEDILLQITAVKSSVHKTGIAILEQDALGCLAEADDGICMDKVKVEKVIKTLIDYSK